jgi:hypothetical protein
VAYETFLVASIVDFALLLVFEAAIAWTATRGAVMNDVARANVKHYLHIHAALAIIELVRLFFPFFPFLFFVALMPRIHGEAECLGFLNMI